ncbi:MAG TPA: hypothetical protein VH120_07455 [Gemmataceae bacterium]|jgi:hypothetical protein|nr:hypothetical protein [Gemmataceae bacterium]
MSTPLVCSALGLPPGRWPPDHYALLGLSAGDVDAAAVEERVLERMERLRKYQLAEPDAVTDAMNRLAQALVCLSDPVAKAAYDTGLRPRSLTTPPVPEPADSYTLAPPEPLRVAPVVPVARPFRPRPLADDVRREAARRRAAIRRLSRTWRDLGNYLRDPGRKLSPAEAIDFVAALLELRERLADETMSITISQGEPGSVVAALARQPLPLSTFRHLLPEQRSALAADWRAGEVRIAAARSTLGRPRRRAAPRVFRKAARVVVADRLNLMIFVLGLAALGLALLRTR